MKTKHLNSIGLAGAVIDCHSHVGLSTKAYACVEYPYAQSLEDLYYRQISAGVDVNVVFPFSADLYYDLPSLVRGELRPAAEPVTDVPYALENRMLMREIFEYNPEHRGRFLPFAMVDLQREIPRQISELCDLEREYPVYGIKAAPIACRTNVTALLNEAAVFIDYARERNVPLLLHTTTDEGEGYSHARDAFKVIDRNRDVRFCLAHCIWFHEAYLELADLHENVWVDTSALKIQVQLLRENYDLGGGIGERMRADYTDHLKVMQTLAARFPDTILWGSDSPYYSFICRRKQEDDFVVYKLKGTYGDEKAALDALPPDLRTRVCNTNTRAWLFGRP